ncbi:hypothetical protein Poli38472_004749 [Pythium oligandrum]|uniref:U-box domain-containing protein n=1 Tax=Pythium oligandrum TaxID=41045 RepID=A0A8K1CAT3_PYTOL|nr:hypothetical protein Poli38472_004749 [Pythium oligandrum]|eukprot:TMW59680.1 hypothetical protein Poli38472_004749 [Pythium oligandrum]
MKFVTGGAVDVLIQMISEPSTQCTKALSALASLAGDDASRATILEAGVLELALPLAKVELDCGVAATKVLSALAVHAGGKAKLRGVEEAPSMMFDALDNGTESHKIYAAATLARILDDDEATADKVATMGGVEKLVTIASTQDGALRNNAHFALDNAFYSSKEAKKIAVEGGHVSLFVNLLKMNVKPDTIVYSLVNLSEQDGLAVTEAGAIPVLVDYIRNEAASVRDCAVLALASIAYMNDRLNAEVVATGLLPVFLDMMRTGSTVEKSEAASILAVLASDATIRPIITALTGITELCVELLKSDEEETQVAALRLITALAEDDHVAVQFVASGAISSLRSFLSAEDDPLLLATKAIGALRFIHQSADSAQLKEHVELALSRLQAMAA